MRNFTTSDIYSQELWASHNYNFFVYLALGQTITKEALMADQVFSVSNMPTIIPGTAGYALPRPGEDVTACLVPADTTMSTPWGSELSAVAGKHYHVCLSQTDHYPNDEFEDYYTVMAELDPTADERAWFLYDYWKQRGYEVKVFLAKKTKPVAVYGVLAEDGTFQTSEGPVPFTKGDILVGSPTMDRIWVLRTHVFLKKYDDVGIRPGLPPESN